MCLLSFVYSLTYQHYGYVFCLLGKEIKVSMIYKVPRQIGLDIGLIRMTKYFKTKIHIISESNISPFAGGKVFSCFPVISYKYSLLAIVCSLVPDILFLTHSLRVIVPLGNRNDCIITEGDRAQSEITHTHTNTTRACVRVPIYTYMSSAPT